MSHLKRPWAAVGLAVTGFAFLWAGTTADPKGRPGDRKLDDYAEVITKDLLTKHLTILAGDEMEGRNTGSAGIDRAADYLAGVYKELGLTGPVSNGSYFQAVPFKGTKVNSIDFKLQKRSNELLQAFGGDANQNFIRVSQGGKGLLEGDVVFGGFGVTDSARGVIPFDDMDLTGKWVLAFQDLPRVVDGDTVLSRNINNQFRLMDLVVRRGASGLILIDSEASLPFDVYVQAFRKQIESPNRVSFPDAAPPGVLPGANLRVKPELAAEMLGVAGVSGLQSLKEQVQNNIRTWKAQPIDFHFSMNIDEEWTDIPAKNVLAFLEGSDPELKDEIVVLSSHYDHVGYSNPDANGDFLNNGADDDGSGTVGVVSVATAFAEAAKNGVRPRRSILFLNVTAEEKGLLGSRYYSDNPVFPVDKTVANINIDMIGRDATEHQEKGIVDGVYIIGAKLISSTMDSLLIVSNNKTHKLVLDESINSVNDPQQIYRRSDHWNFGRLGIPFVFYFTGLHEDYHRPSDEVDKINFDKMTKIAQLVYQNTLEIANADDRPVVDNQEFIEKTRSTPRR